jgi:hypothetical protein
MLKNSESLECWLNSDELSFCSLIPKSESDIDASEQLDALSNSLIYSNFYSLPLLVLIENARFSFYFQLSVRFASVLEDLQPLVWLLLKCATRPLLLVEKG